LDARQRIILVGNPGSGSGEAAAVEERLRAQAARLDTVAVEDLDGASLHGARRVVVAGGDGSIAPVAELAGREGVPLAVVPVGTANDFARTHKLPVDPATACELALEGEEVRSLDLGRVGDRPFVNVASAGLAPVAAREARGLKRAIGPLAYSAGALRAALRAKPLRCAVRCDRRIIHEGQAWQVTVACGGAFGGGASVDADPGDGRLDAVVLPAGSRAALAWRAYGLRSGRVERQGGVSDARCSEVAITASGRLALNVDGEVWELCQPHFSVEPGAFELVVA
jgi:diacylglycerol kinase family enzyme